MERDALLERSRHRIAVIERLLVLQHERAVAR
jgi:hypothetical protein